MARSITTKSISREECERIIGRIHAECDRTGAAATIAIVDGGGVLKALSRSDNAFNPMAVQAAIDKALTSLNSGRSTRDFWDIVRGDETLLACVPSLPNVLALPGGVPIYDGDVMIGALGVAGTGLYPEDESLARIGVGDESSP